MKKLLLLPLLVFAVACEGNPAGPSDVQGSNENAINQIVNIFIGGDDDHSGKDPGEDDTNGGDPTTNSAPLLILPSTITSEVGESVTVDLLATDADGDAVTIGFDPQSAPRNCDINGTGPSSARLSCVISSSSVEDSPFTVRVQADDGNGNTTVGFFLWIVNPPAEV